MIYCEMKYRERDGPLHICHWAILVLRYGPWIWSRQDLRWWPSKQIPPPHPSPPIDVPICDTYPACLFPCKVLLTFYLIEALDLLRPAPMGPLGLPSRRMELLAVRRFTSLPNLAAEIKWSTGTAKRRASYLPGMMQLPKKNHFGIDDYRDRDLHMT